MYVAAERYNSATRNKVRDRISDIQDRLATNELAMEIVTYDKDGKEVKGEGKTDPVGFKNHLDLLMSMIGERQMENPEEAKRNKMLESAKAMESFFGGALL